MNELISISHKIELKPNNKAKTHFKKAFGCARLAYNWGLAKWQEYYKQLGQVLPKVTPADLTAMLDDLVINKIVTSKVETGIQHKVYK